MDPKELTPNTYTDANSTSVLRDHIKRRRNLGTVLIAQAAKDGGADVTWINHDFAVAELEGRRTLLYQNRVNELSSAMALAAHKHFSKQLFQQSGVETPRGRAVSSAPDALVTADELAGPVVVKPASDMKGRGITVGVSHPNDVEEAYRRARHAGSLVVVEEWVRGEEYRCLVTPTACSSSTWFCERSQ